MQTGTPADVLARLRALVPSNWLPLGPLPVLDSILSGPAAALSGIYGLLQYARAMMRLATSAGSLLDLWAYDFFGPALPRLPGEQDTAFRARISATMFQPRATRQAVIATLTNLTGIAPVIFEPWRQADCGGWNTGYLGWTTGPGALGSSQYPYQMFVTAYRPKGKGVANLQGWGTPGSNPIGIGGWGTRLLAWVSFGVAESIVTDADIYAAVAAVMSSGTIAWVQIQDAA